MNIGMMWFDKSPDLATKVKAAVDYYRNKYGKEPNFCLVHPGTLAQMETNEVMIGNVRVREFKGVLPMHLWIGTEDKVVENET